jgi:hypothetical protein
MLNEEKKVQNGYVKKIKENKRGITGRKHTKKK